MPSIIRFRMNLKLKETLARHNTEKWHSFMDNVRDKRNQSNLDVKEGLGTAPRNLEHEN
jgi:hypothetical protein